VTSPVHMFTAEQHGNSFHDSLSLTKQWKANQFVSKIHK